MLNYTRLILVVILSLKWWLSERNSSFCCKLLNWWNIFSGSVSHCAAKFVELMTSDKYHLSSCRKLLYSSRNLSFCWNTFLYITSIFHNFEVDCEIVFICIPSFHVSVNYLIAQYRNSLFRKRPLTLFTHYAHTKSIWIICFGHDLRSCTPTNYEPICRLSLKVSGSTEYICIL